MTDATLVHPAPAPLSASSLARPTGYRPDIEGLRALAVVLVVLNHIGLAFLGGGYVGVDVFFVISGFLITALLLGEHDRSGRTSIVGFYARRARRILPLGTLVLLVTLLASWWAGGAAIGRSVGLDTLWSALFAGNIHFAESGVDYFNRDSAPSPLEHYWSLGVEEQFYFVWPLLFLLVGLAFRDRGRRHRLGLLALLMTVIGASLVWSILRTDTDPTRAYFSPFTRAFELGIGAALAVALPWLVPYLRRWTSAALAAAGLGAIVAAAVLLDDASRVPGFVALVPVLGTAALILAGSGSAGGTHRWLGAGPLQFIGRRSYGWYLWHLPFLIVPVLWAGRPLEWWENLGLALLSFLAACVTYPLVEEPARHHAWLRARPWASLGMGLALVTTVVVAALPLQSLDAGQGTAAAPAYLPGEVEVLAEVAKGAKLTTAPADLKPDLDLIGAQSSPAGADADGVPCGKLLDVSEATPCILGDPRADRTVALWGDSHAEMWIPALDDAARRGGYRLAVFAKYLCMPLLGVDSWNYAGRKPFTECEEFKDGTLEAIKGLEPEAVMVAGAYHGFQWADEDGELVEGGEHGAGLSWTPNETGQKTWQAGLARSIDALSATGARVVVLGGIPHPPADVGECLPKHADDVQQCGVSRAEGVHAEQDEATAATAKAGNAEYVRVLPWLCTETTCPPIIGGRVVYRDAYHLTAQYSAWLSGLLGAATGLTEAAEGTTTGGTDSGGLEDAVRKATRLTSAPSDVNPPLAHIGERSWWSMEDDDGVDCGKTSDVDDIGPCMIGSRKADRTIAVWGDQRAEQWLPGLDALGHEHGYRIAVFSKLQCRPLLGVRAWSSEKKRHDPGCGRFNAEAVEAIRDLEPEQVVIAGGFYGFKWSEDGDPVDGGTFGKGALWTPTETGESTWQAGLARSLDALKGTGAELVVLGDTPTPLVDSRECLPANADKIQACSFPRAGHVYDAHNEAEAATAHAHGARYLPTTPWLCTDEVCPPLIRGRVVYANSYYLSVQYSQRLAGVLARALGVTGSG